MEDLKKYFELLKEYVDQIPFPIWWILVGTVIVAWVGYLIKCRYSAGGK